MTRLIAVVLLVSLIAFAQKKTSDQLRTDAERASGGHQAMLYAQLAEQLVTDAEAQFTAGESAKAQQSVQQVRDAAARARDAGIKSHRKLKDIEIHLRETQRHLDNVKRTLAAEDRPALDEVEKKIEQYRQDLLDTMFPPKKERKK
jgi:hypothetical protein